mmetsp:Transcript_3410/g.13205  ORF Transcript_3410/g.13205 Transcript_3410/m.13205 type:complete len:201 (-) Transcript_3410:2301-2903(-)
MHAPHHFGDGARRQSRVRIVAVNRERFPTPRLSVCENTHVISVHGALNEILGVFEDLFLRRVCRKNFIKFVRAILLFSSPRMRTRELIRSREYSLLILTRFDFRQRTRSGVDSNLTLQILQHVEVASTQRHLGSVLFFQFFDLLRLARHEFASCCLLSLKRVFHLAQLLELVEHLLRHHRLLLFVLKPKRPNFRFKLASS